MIDPVRFVIGIILITFTIVGFGYVLLNGIDIYNQTSCLLPIAQQYCSNLNGTLYQQNMLGSFQCKQHGDRTSGDDIKLYYFSPEEKKSCGVGSE